MRRDKDTDEFETVVLKVFMTIMAAVSAILLILFLVWFAAVVFCDLSLTVQGVTH